MSQVEKWQLTQRQNLPLKFKIKYSEKRIKDWYELHDGNVYVAFSGGKDSTVLLHLVRSMYPEVPAVFNDTGLEYPEIRDFVKSTDNVVWLKPEMSFKKVLEVYGYPVVSKKVARMISDLRRPASANPNTRKLYLTGIKSDGTKTRFFKLPDKWKKLIDCDFKISAKCCDILKKNPAHLYEKETGRKSFLGIMAADSRQRERGYLQTGCNNIKTGKSIPMAHWFTPDVWEYIKGNGLPYCSVYDAGLENTGCMFCLFGVHLESPPNRFQQMKLTHSKQYRYCMETLGIRPILEFLDIPFE